MENNYLIVVKYFIGKTEGTANMVYTYKKLIEDAQDILCIADYIAKYNGYDRILIINIIRLPI